ncbi:FAD-binding oxidoreductase [Pseudonocardia oroxyli]|uniref:FAD/FMN-containing dehydrogenase n=1 Tax=Pseudonocardia oroxyli TaxID=366584 RepID=A0A1G7RN79_PSEOR|nr:FAD-binding oxidoreductase [Pseudonocardia oroxyli]SDG12241.1 FAD/FMN-containing dehydrogenase [Pseudonocardia oroxyli]
MTSTAPITGMTGPVLLPTDPGYDEARSMWNGLIDHRPGLIARCTGPHDVAAALAFARSAGLEVAVRGGGHGVWTARLEPGFLLLDLAALNTVEVDPVERTVRCGGGTLLADLDAATQAHGLAVPAGTVSNTGIGGLTLGGGWGWLSRLYGLTIDNLLSCEVVLPDGRVVRASDAENPELFWGLRGGGGNFGVVTEFEFRLHPVGPVIQFGMVFVEQARAAAALQAYDELMREWPASVSGGIACAAAPPAPFVPAQHHFAAGVALVLAGFGDPAEHAAAVKAAAERTAPLFAAEAPLPYVALQQMLDAAALHGTRDYTKGLYLDAITPDVAAVLAEWTGRRSPTAQLLAFRLDQAISAVPDAATAFGGPRTGLAVAIEGIDPDPAQDAAERDWARGTWAALRPYATNAGGYVNLVGDLENALVDDVYAGKLDRLRRVKAQYDPENLLHVNANIAPA